MDLNIVNTQNETLEILSSINIVVLLLPVFDWI